MFILMFRVITVPLVTGNSDKFKKILLYRGVWTTHMDFYLSGSPLKPLSHLLHENLHVKILIHHIFKQTLIWFPFL